MKLVVDANVFISALIAGKAAELLFNPDFELITTERTTWEVKKYLPSWLGILIKLLQASSFYLS